MLENINTSPNSRDDGAGTPENYLSRAVPPARPGDARLGLHLYLAAFEQAAEQSDAPSEDAIMGLKQAWRVALHQERALAEYHFRAARALPVRRRSAGLCGAAAGARHGASRGHRSFRRRSHGNDGGPFRRLHGNGGADDGRRRSRRGRGHGPGRGAGGAVGGRSRRGRRPPSPSISSPTTASPATAPPWRACALWAWAWPALPSSTISSLC